MPTSIKQLSKNPREEFVAQGNDLIRHVRFPLTELEQNIIYFVMSKVKPNDTDFMRQTFTVKEFCKACGIHVGDRSGASYQRIKSAIKTVSDKSAWIEYPDGREQLIRWFDTYEIDRTTGTLTATLSQSIKPYLIGLIERVKAGGEGFTQSHLYTYFAMKSKYSKRLYEVLKSYLYSSGNQEKLYRLVFQEYVLDELQLLLNAYDYVRWVDFKRRVLEPSVKEINEVTDITISYSVVKNGRKITGINFSFQHKQTLERIGAETVAKKILDTPRKSPKPKDTSPIQEPPDEQITLNDETMCDTTNESYVNNCVDCKFSTHEATSENKDTEDILAHKIPKEWQDCMTHEHLICFAKSKGYEIGWAFHKAKDLKLPVLSKTEQKKIYDNCEFDINIRLKSK